MDQRHRLQTFRNHPSNRWTSSVVFILACAVVIFGMRSTLSHQIASAFLGSSSIAVVGYVACKIRGNTVGLIAAAIAVLHPSFWSWDGMILSETLAILASASLLLFFVSSTQYKSNRWYVLGGVLAGIAILSRAELLMATVLLSLGVLILQRSRTAVKHAAIMAGVAIIVLTPWAAYNTARFDRFVPLSNSAGVTLAASNCADVAGQYAGRWSYFCAVEAAERVTKNGQSSIPKRFPIPQSVQTGKPISQMQKYRTRFRPCISI